MHLTRSLTLGWAALASVGLAGCPAAHPNAVPRSQGSANAAPTTYPRGPYHYRKGTPGAPYARQALPDPSCTPGATNPAVTQADIGSTICARGWTSKIRPPESYTEPLKRAALKAYGQAGPLGAYELDHLVPLELGGAPSDARNLWPEPDNHPSAYYLNSKDRVEDQLRSAVCEHRVSLAAARSAIAADWEMAETSLRVQPAQR
ncbi:MAG: hypothetical protein ACRD0E_00155 [Acidimicrobiales bacterium]